MHLDKANPVIKMLIGLLLSGSVIGQTLTGGLFAKFTGHSQKALVRDLTRYDIQYIAYGDTHELVIPTDRYFEFDSHRLNDQCYVGLMDIIQLLKYYPCSIFYVAGFTDDVGSRHHKNKLSQSRADAMTTFLWSYGIRAQALHSEGYGDKFPVGDNHITHGSAYNRRVEIQWVNIAHCSQLPMVAAFDSK